MRMFARRARFFSWKAFFYSTKRYFIFASDSRRDNYVKLSSGGERFRFVCDSILRRHTHAHAHFRYIKHKRLKISQ